MQAARSAHRHASLQRELDSAHADDSKHQVILAAEVFASQDHENLKPMLDDAKKNLVAIGKEPDYFVGKELTADSNYHSLASLKVCQDEKVDAYIPDIQFRQRDPRFADQESFKDGKQTDAKPSPFSAADFSYDDSKYVYLCPNGKELKCHAHNQVNRHRTYEVYHARVEDCATCPLRSRCLSKSDASRRYLSIQVDTGQPNLIDIMKAKIDSEQGKKIYARRLGIVEPVFANICMHKNMDRFHPAYQTQSGCTMGIIRSGTQYRQNPRFRDVDISLF